MPDTDGKPIGIGEAHKLREQFMATARRLATVAGDERLPWGERYEAAVLGDEALDDARLMDELIRAG
ncbi:hypothetical protein [Bradyrhizobium denitrificans]|uniref:hypothetical protein n=1 Tax=Bradyrhizobium denitrificans TaxID=2734912 RepID=UPI001553F6A3|nr:hypothetical protein [Bradyrhizobium sp. LMG 8443]NPU23968.1 hypothetical protein [Bradyrhizobium sp. LMG 8443]